MSIGLGIFLSATALLLIWQVDKHGAWRSALKCAAWFGGILALIAGSLGIYLWWESEQPQRERRAQLETVRTGRLDHYAGLRLGMTQNEVIYVKGKPIERLHNAEGAEYWEFGDSEPANKRSLYVFWSKAQTVETIVCANGGMPECQVAGDIDLGAGEDLVRAQLGAPQEETKPDDDGTKSITYGAGRSQLRLVFWQRRVIAIFLIGTKTSKFTIKRDDASGSAEGHLAPIEPPSSHHGIITEQNEQRK